MSVALGSRETILIIGMVAAVNACSFACGLRIAS
jgi:hypothetical protein